MDVVPKANHVKCVGRNGREISWKHARIYSVVCVLCFLVFGAFLDKLEFQRIISSMPEYVQEKPLHVSSSHRILKSFLEVEKLTSLLPWTGHEHPSSNMTRLTIGVMPHRATSCGPTHPKNTTVTLMFIVRDSETIPWASDNGTDQKVNIFVGDILVFLLEAKDVSGNPKIGGGDYWHAVMKNENGTASTVGRILDHDNGRYTLLFLVAWSGVIRLHITLVHPAEFSKWFKTEYLHHMRGPHWLALFREGDITEKTTCYLSVDATWAEKCVLMSTNALRYSRLICDLPKTLPCDALTAMSATRPKYTEDLKKRLPKSKAQFLKSPYLYGKVWNVPKDILVKDGETIKEHVLSDESFELPPCQPDLHVPLTEGYWWNKTWFSLTCGPTVLLTKSAVQQCLRSYNVYFLGDSTTRQWFATFAEVLGHGRKEDHERVFTLRRRDEEANLNLTFYFHPFTDHPPSVLVNISTVKFEADVFLELPQHCRNVVVFSPWAHFCLWQWEAYVDWLKGIRTAILVAKQRCPDLTVVAKSPHPVNKWSSMPGRDCIYDEMRRLTRDMFKGLGVIFIDIWDMDLASPWPIDLHMPSDVISQEVSVLLSYLCPLLDKS